MKEEADGSSRIRRPSRTRFDDRPIIPDWASLPPELVQGIADCALSTTGGVDTYMDMRAVCPSWRSAVAKPSPLAAVADLRFHPRHRVMVDLKSESRHGDARLFLHVPTGRFRRLRLPAPRDHTLAGATDGLLVLGDRERPHLARVLNPFTGDMLHFSAPLPQDFKCTAVKGGSPSTLVLLHSFGIVLFAAPTSHVFTMKDNRCFLNSLVNFQGNIYCASEDGRVFEFIAPAELVVVAEVSLDVDVYAEEDDSVVRSYLVESAGELLLVRYVDRSSKVFRVNIEHKLLEVKSLGGRALFLGKERCVSVDADKLPSVDRDCIYMLDIPFNQDMCGYNLRGDMVDIISREKYLDRPFSLVQILLRYGENGYNL